MVFSSNLDDCDQVTVSCERFRKVVPQCNTVVYVKRSVCALPEIRADMTRTSLVDGITPFCFTCANNIQLVCGNAKRQKIYIRAFERVNFYLSEASTPVATLQGFTALCITTALRTSWVLGLAIATANTASSE